MKRRESGRDRGGGRKGKEVRVIADGGYKETRRGKREG